MKNRTKEAAGLIRVVAGIVFFVGMVGAGILILFGVMALATKDNSFVVAMLRTTSITTIISGLAVAVSHLVVYALLIGFSVIVENSDRTVVENALFEIADKSKDAHYEDEIEQN